MSHHSYSASEALRVPSRRRLSARAVATREKLLEAAEKEFAERGYHGTGVAAIALRAGLAQGTLYIYFQSKDEIFTTLVRYIGMRLRKQTAAALGRGTTRLDGERRALEAFLSFVQQHPGTYRIIQELQFVDEKLYREYYRTFVRSYARSMDRAVRDGQLSPGGNEARAWSMIGIAHFLGLNHCQWDKKMPGPAVMRDVMHFVTHGMGTDA